MNHLKGEARDLDKIKPDEILSSSTSNKKRKKKKEINTFDDKTLMDVKDLLSSLSQL